MIILYSTDLMQFAHILLPHELGQIYNELTKIEVSINSAALKHLALSEAYKINGAFRADQPHAVRDRLLQAIWKKLSEEDRSRSRVPHFFLPYDIRILAIGCYAVDHWLPLKCLIKEQVGPLAPALNVSPINVCFTCYSSFHK